MKRNGSVVCLIAATRSSGPNMLGSVASGTSYIIRRSADYFHKENGKVGLKTNMEL
jgi:hypothetical protein